MGHRINKLMIANGDDQTTLAAKIGVTPQAVQQWIANETTPRKANIVKLCSIFNCSIDHLLVGNSDAIAESQPLYKISITTQPIPVRGTAQLGDNGHWCEMDYPQKDGDGFINYPTKYQSTYAVRCKGDSMSPRIKDGEFAIIEPDIEPQPGDEVLISSLDGRVMIKKLLYIRDNKVHLISINDSHPPQTIDISIVQTMHYVAGIARTNLWYHL